MLNEIRDQLDPSEKKFINNLNYCIKMIQSNKLYEAELQFQNYDD